MRLYFTFFLFTTTFLFSQSKLKVYSSDNQKPIKGAKVYCNDKLLGHTDENGLINFTTKCTKVDVEANQFIGDEVVVDKTMEIALDKESSKTRDIEAVTLTNQSDPRALAILDKVFRSFKDNSPNALDSYSYKSYEKMSFDLDQDSINDYSQFIASRKDSLSKLSSLSLNHL